MNVLTTTPPLPIVPPQEKRVYRVDEIQDILGISRSRAYKLVQEKKFHSIRVGQSILISKKSFDNWMGL